MGFTPDGKTSRYVINSKGDIFLCSLVTFSDAKDALYLPAPERAAGAEGEERFPHGWWTCGSTYGTKEEAVAAALAAKEHRIAQKERIINELKQKIRDAENGIGKIKDEIRNIRDGSAEIEDLTGAAGQNT